MFISGSRNSRAPRMGAVAILALAAGLAHRAVGADASTASNDAGRAGDECVSAKECEDLASRYHHGKGVPKDGGKAARLYEIACDKGSPSGCKGIAMLLSTGVSVPFDEARALKFYQRACDLGDKWACGAVAQSYAQGSQVPGAVPQDLPRAARLYQGLCDDGDACSCINLADLYSHGRGVKKDKRRAKELTERGRKNGCDARE
jgi:uncharacterized protein